MDFNSCNIMNNKSLANGRFASSTIRMNDFRTVYGVTIARSVLAKTNNGAIVPVYIIYNGQTKDYKSMGIFCDGTFKQSCPEFYSQYELNSNDYEVTRICEEFNSGTSPIETELNIETTFPTNDDKISLEDFVEKFSGIIDLKYSYEVYSAPEHTEYLKIISTHNVIACKDNSNYLMPCTVEFKNDFKTICFCFIRLDLGTAIPFYFMQDKFDANNEKLLKRIISVRPLIVSPVGENDVVVSEGLKLRFITQQELDIIIGSAE